MKKILTTVLIAGSFINVSAQKATTDQSKQATNIATTNQTEIKVPVIIAPPAIIHQQPKLVQLPMGIVTPNTGVQNINKVATVQQTAQNAIDNKASADTKALPVNVNMQKIPEVKGPDKPSMAAPLVKINN